MHFDVVAQTQRIIQMREVMYAKATSKVKYGKKRNRGRSKRESGVRRDDTDQGQTEMGISETKAGQKIGGESAYGRKVSGR